MTRQAATICLILWLISLDSRADARCEIDHLLGFIESSRDTFVRNGEEHDAEAAKVHIERKYNHAKRWIETAEQFIEYAATLLCTRSWPSAWAADRGAPRPSSC